MAKDSALGVFGGQWGAHKLPNGLLMIVKQMLKESWTCFDKQNKQILKISALISMETQITEMKVIWMIINIIYIHLYLFIDFIHKNSQSLGACPIHIYLSIYYHYYNIYKTYTLRVDINRFAVYVIVRVH